jgi:hypothetical protein
MKDIDLEKVFGRIFLVLISVFIAFVIADRISFRLLGSSRSPIEQKYPVQAVRRPKPYVMFGGVPSGKIWTGKLNKRGYIDNAPAQAKDPGEFRIIVIGGSAIVMGDPPIPRRLEYKFRDEGCGNIKVYNFGVVSSVTGMELARVIFEIVDYDPDLIVSYSGFNDMDQPFVADPRPGYPLNFIVYENNPLLESDVRAYPALPLLLYGSNLARHLAPAYFEKRFIPIDRVREEAGYGSEEWMGKIAETYVTNIAKSARIAGAFHARFAAFFQPSLYFKEPLSDREMLQIGPARKKNSLAIYHKILAGISAVKSEAGLDFVDLADIYDGISDTVYDDRVHTYQKYYPLVVDKMYGAIMEILKRDPKVDLNSLCQ